MNEALSYIIPVVIGLTLGFLLINFKNAKGKSVHTIDPQTFKSNMRKGQLIDVRKAKQFEEDKIKGARNFSPGYLKGKHQTKVRKDMPVYLYCKNGRKSIKTAKKLLRKDFSEVYVLDGGFDKYKATIKRK